eukprot:3526473-Prymnesium_polylepis.1
MNSCRSFGSDCNYFTVEGQGPRTNDIWCRVAPFTNDDSHRCKDDPSLYCHVVTMRVGPSTGSYLKVDEGSPDVSTTMPKAQAAFFGAAGELQFNFPYLKELKAYNFELDDNCLDFEQGKLRHNWIGAMPPPVTPPPPPIPLPPLFAGCSTAVPFIHTGWQANNVNQGGTFQKVDITGNTSAMSTSAGAWTVTFAVRSDDVGRWGHRQLIHDSTERGAHDNLTRWNSIESSIGVGRQLVCGATQSGHWCEGGTQEADRGSCSATTLFHEEAYACHTGGGCSYVVAEGSGPTVGKVWCRVVRIGNNDQHHCRDDPTKFCHVITVRVGPTTGTLLRVDKEFVDSSSAMATNQKAFFGRGNFTIDSSV